MPRFSRKEQAICPSCGDWKSTDFTPEQLKEMDWECADCEAKKFNSTKEVPQERGSQEISVYDDAYIFLKKLVMLVGKAVPEAVPEIKALSLQHPFETVDDAGDLAAQIWTLATIKYNIPREWLIKRLPEKKGSLKHADLWPAQAASENMLSHDHNSLSYNPLQEADTSAQGPKPIDAKMDLAWSIISDKFFTSHERWSSVVSELKTQIPSISDEDIKALRDKVKESLNTQMGAIASKKQAKKKSLNIDKVVQVLNSKEPKVTHVDIVKQTIELEDGSVVTFDEAVKKAMEIDKTGVFSGAEFSTTEFNVNPTLDNGPYSSPEDAGATPQEQPFPNTGWLPADDENKDEQPWSNIASSLNRKAERIELSSPDDLSFYLLVNPSQGEVMGALNHSESHELRYIMAGSDTFVWDAYYGTHDWVWEQLLLEGYGQGEHPELGIIDNEQGIRSLTGSTNRFFSKKAMDNYTAYWIDPNGNSFLVPETTHTDWALNNADKIEKEQGITIDDTYPIDSLIKNGWTRTLISNKEIIFEVADLSHLNSLDKFISENWTPEHRLVKIDIGRDGRNGIISIDDPFPTLEEAVNKAKRHSFSKKELNLVKKADESPLTQEDQNEISAVSCPAYVIALNNYASAVKRGHEKDRALAYAVESVKNLEKIDEKKLVEFINTYL